MRVIVFGSSGLLGCSLIPHLKACGYEVFTGESKSHHHERVDLTDAKQVKAILDDAKPEVIVNLVALTNVDECERDPQRAYLLNVKTIENLSGWMRVNQNVSHLVQISTDQLYDGKGPHRESDITLTNTYAFSKYAGELAAKIIPSTILRTNFFGQSQCLKRSSISDWLVSSLTQGNSITVFDDIYFSPLTLQRLVQFIEFVIKKRERGIFNLGSREGMSKADFCFALAETLGLPTKHMKRGSSEAQKLDAYRPKDMRLDSSFFEEVFDLELPTLWQEIQSLKDVYHVEN